MKSLIEGTKDRINGKNQIYYDVSTKKMRKRHDNQSRIGRNYLGFFNPHSRVIVATTTR